MWINDLTNIEIMMLIISVVIFLGLFYTSMISFLEKEKRAGTRAFWASIFIPIPLVCLVFFDVPFKNEISIILMSAILLGLIILFLPIGKRRITVNDIPESQIDERDIMFSRGELEPGSDRFAEYYKNNPENLEVDDAWRKKAGLCQPGSSMFNKYQFASAHSSFETVSYFHQAVDNEPTEEKSEVDAKDLSNYIKRWGQKLGALDVGITEMEDYHYYSHRGRGDEYGKENTQRHKYGIVVSVEMDKDMLSYAPAGPTVMESAQQYLNAGVIALQISEFIRQLGYNARAHIDGNYQVVCPLVARDAGMGEIGRMGLLMTPKLGPRVRLAVITSDIPLITNERPKDYSMIDFCIKCKKCANVCPSNSISFTDPGFINGAERWQINQESCYDFWCQIGTDCGRCVAACPYSHPDNPLHNVVRFGIKNSSIFRSFAAKMDDALYGKIPSSVKVPDWMDI